MKNVDFDDKFEEIREAVERKFAGSAGDHDFDHTLRVLNNALLLLKKFPEADPEVVRFAVLLHDIARPEEDAACGGVCHAVRGAEIAEKWLLAAGFPAEFSARVAAAVRIHRYRGKGRPHTVEGKILFDADKLDSLGAAGLGRAFLFAGKCGARLHNRAEEALGGSAYSREDTAYREYLVKLRKLPEAMTTEPGRREGARRLRFMTEFFARLDLECGLGSEKIPLETCKKS